MAVGAPVTSYATSPHRQLPTVLPGSAATAGRFMGAMSPSDGGYASYRGSESVISYQGAFDPTNMCPCTRMPGSSSSVPAGTNARPSPGISDGATDPHAVQNERV